MSTTTTHMPKWLAYLIAAPAVVIGAAIYLAVAWVVLQPVLALFSAPMTLGGLLLGVLCAVVLFAMVTMPVELLSERQRAKSGAGAPITEQAR